MLVELLVAFTLYKLATQVPVTTQTGGAESMQFSSAPNFLQFILALIVCIAYFLTIGRSVITAFSCQGVGQGLFALLTYPLYLIWNVTTLIRKSCK
jgi:hypothetical protein